MTAGLPLMKIGLTPFSKSVLVPSRSTEAASAAYVTIQKKSFGSGMTALIVSNEEIYDIIKIVKSLEKLDLVIKSVSETIKNNAKEQKNRFAELKMLLGALGASLLGNMLAGNRVVRAGDVVI